MNKFKYIVKLGAFMLLLALSFTACTDKNDWEVDSTYDRLFSVNKMSVSANATDIEFTWTGTPSTEYYIIELSKDSLYDAIEMGEHSSSIIYGEDKSIKTSPVVLNDLDSDSKYFLRIKSLSSNKEESKWGYLEKYSFTTKSEQIITNITVGATDVTIEWPANSKVTNIVLSDGRTQNLTNDEMAIGKVVVTGLTSETEYTIKLMNGTVTRGSKVFTTLINLEGAIAINPGDDIVELLTNAEEGDVFAVMPGNYEVSDKISLTKTISIKAAKPGEATIKDLFFDLKAGIGLELRDLILDGTNATGQLINYPDDHKTAETPDLNISNCNITNYSKGLINLRKMVEVKSMSITGNIINNIGERLIDIQAGYSKIIDLSKNTITNSKAGDAAIRIDNKATDFTGVKSVIMISNNTFYKVFPNGALRFIYVRLSGNEITLTNNLMTYSQAGYSDQSTTKVVEMTNNYYFEAPNFLEGSAKVLDSNGTVLDPQFADAKNGDFTPLNKAVVNAGVGDPRWLD